MRGSIGAGRCFFTAALTVLSLLSAGCTPDESEDRERIAASGADFADELIAAWNAEDLDVLGTISGDSTGSTRLIRTLRKATKHGRITDFEVRSGGGVAQPTSEEIEAGETITVGLPYSVSWTSEAAANIATLQGSMDLTYEPESDAWSADLGPGMLWPGIEGARGFTVEFQWHPRGAILDRNGRVLADGSGLERSYPFGTAAGTTIGHLGILDAAAIDEGALGEVGDPIGGSGLEEAFDERLGGRPTAKLNLLGRKDKVLETLGALKGTRGKDLHTTLDVDIQKAAEAAYGDTVGGAVVIHPPTGDLLAVVDSSTFDPNNYVGAAGVEPFNRALSGGYPPGSAMKVVTASAALDTGTVQPTTTVTGPKEYKGVRNFESGKFGSIPFATALKYSVNTAFAQVAEDLGAARMTRYATRFGFNKDPRLGLDVRTSSYPRPADLGDLMWSAVGQAQVLATPLQMASVVATIANDGTRMEPRIDARAPEVGKRVVSAETAEQMTVMMQSVVEGGTGVNARIPGVAVAGKTGTAEVDVAGERKNHAWFVCFAPAGSPQVAVAVVSEYGGIGGEVAAPLARAILLRVLPMAPR